jgi:hypothetical protein
MITLITMTITASITRRGEGMSCTLLGTGRC